MPRLDIRMAEGRGFPKGGSKPDPYVILKMGKDEQQTEVIAKSTAPRWQQVFKFKFEENDREKLFMEVWNKNFFSDSKIGWYSMSVEHAIEEARGAAGGVVDKWVKLNECSTLGELHIRFSFDGLDMSSSTSAPPPAMNQEQQQHLAAPPVEGLMNSSVGAHPLPGSHDNRRVRSQTFGPGGGAPPPAAGQYPQQQPPAPPQQAPANWNAPPDTAHMGVPPQDMNVSFGLGGGNPYGPPSGYGGGYEARPPQGQWAPNQLYTPQPQQHNFASQNHWFAIPESELRIAPGPPVMDLGKSITYSCFHPMTNGAPSVLKRYRTQVPPSNEAFEALDKLRKASEHPSMLYCFAPVRGLDPQGSIVGMLLGSVSMTFQDWIKRNNADPEAIIRGLQSAATGLAHLHSMGITHGNIKTSKFVVEVSADNPSQPHVMLSAYGPSRLTGNVEATFYTAPEYGLTQKKEPSVDAYSFGLAAWLLLHGPDHEFIKGVPPQEVSKKLQSGQRPSIDVVRFGPAIAHLLEQCWKPEPDRRPTMKSIVETLGTVLEGYGSPTHAAMDGQMRVYIYAVERDPASAMNWVNLARGLVDDKTTVVACGERHSKKTAYTRAVECDPRSATTWTSLAQTMDKSEKINIGGKGRSRRDCMVKAVLCDESDSVPWAELALELPTYQNDRVYIKEGLEDLTKVDCLRKALSWDPNSARARTAISQLKTDKPGLLTEILTAAEAESDASPTWIRILKETATQDLEAALGNDPDYGPAWFSLGMSLQERVAGLGPKINHTTINGQSYSADECLAQAVFALDDAYNERTPLAASRWFALADLMLVAGKQQGEVNGIKCFDACRRAMELRHLNDSIPPPNLKDFSDPSMWPLWQFVGKSFAREIGNDQKHKLGLPEFDVERNCWKPNPKEYSKAEIICHGLETRPLPTADEPARVEHAPLWRLLLRETDENLGTLSVRGVRLDRGRCLAMLTQVEPRQGRNWYDFAIYLNDKTSGRGYAMMEIQALGSGITTEIDVMTAISNAIRETESGFQKTFKRLGGGRQVRAPDTQVAQFWFKAGQIARSQGKSMLSDRGEKFDARECFVEAVSWDPTFGPGWGALAKDPHWKECITIDFGGNVGNQFQLELTAKYAVLESVEVEPWKEVGRALLFDQSFLETSVTIEDPSNQGKARTIKASDCFKAALAVNPSDREAKLMLAVSNTVFAGSDSKGGKLQMVNEADSTKFDEEAKLLAEIAEDDHGGKVVNTPLFWLAAAKACWGSCTLIKINGKNLDEIACCENALRDETTKSSFKPQGLAFDIRCKIYYVRALIRKGTSYKPKVPVSSIYGECQREITTLLRSANQSMNPSSAEQIARKLKSTWIQALLDGIEAKVVSRDLTTNAQLYADLIHDYQWKLESHDAAAPSSYYKSLKALGTMFIERSNQPGQEKEALDQLELSRTNPIDAFKPWTDLLEYCLAKKSGVDATEGEAWYGLAYVLSDKSHSGESTPSHTLPALPGLSERKVNARYCLETALETNPFTKSHALKPKSEEFISSVYTLAAKLMISLKLDTLQLNGQTFTAQGLVDEALKLWPKNAAAHKRNGRLALIADNTSKAKTSLERSLALDRTDSDVHALLGRIAATEGQYDKANRLFIEAVECDPGSDFAWNNLGYALAGLPPGKSMACRVEVGKPAHRHKGSHPIYEKPYDVEKCKAVSFTRPQVYAISLETSEHAARIAYTWNCLGESLYALGPTTTEKVNGTAYDARACFERGLSIKPESARAMVGLARLERQDRSKRLDLLERALTASPNHPEGLEMAGHCLRVNSMLRAGPTAMKNGKDASACFAQALSLSVGPNNTPSGRSVSWQGLGLVTGANTVALPSGNVTKRQCFENALKIDTRDAVSWAGIATCLGPEEQISVGGNKYDCRACFIFAIDFIDKNKDELVDQAFNWNCLAAYLLTQRDPLALRSQPAPVDARKCHENALQCDPGDGYTFGRLAMTFPRGTPEFFNNLVQACERDVRGGGAFWVELANALQPNQPGATVAGNFISKVDMLKRGLTFDPHNAFGWICLGCTLQPHEFTQEYNPRECFMKAVTCAKPDSNGWNYLASTMNDYERINVYGYGELTKADCMNRGRPSH